MTDSTITDAARAARASLAEAKALVIGGQDDRGLVRLRALLTNVPHHLDSSDLADALALAVAANPTGLVKISPKWSSRAAAAVEDVRRTGGMTETVALHLVRVLLIRGETAAARAGSDWLARHFAHSRDVALLLVDLYRVIGEPAAALTTLIAAVQAHPDDEHLNRLVAERLVGLGRGAEAMPYAVALNAKAPSAAAAIVLARARIATGDPDAAPPLLLTALRQHGARSGDLAPAIHQLIEVGAAKAAVALLNDLLEGAPADPKFQRLRVDALIADGDLAAAAGALDIVLAAAPTIGDFEVMCDVLLAQGRPDAAARALTAMRMRFPREMATAIVRAKVLAAKGEADKAANLSDIIGQRAMKTGSTPMGRMDVVMAGVIGSHGLGDFIYQLLALASLKRQFSNARLTLIYNNELSYKNELLRFCADLDEVRDCAGGAIAMPVATKDFADFRQHMMFTQASLSPTLLARLDRTATFTTPAEDVDRLTTDLVARGLDPNRWFVAIHYRQSAIFSARNVGSRDVDGATFHRLAKSICDAGGQVVRLGHRGMDPIAPHPGYIDVSDGSLSLQLFAVSKARFMVGCDSGPSGYATAFKTPLFKTNTFSEDGAAYETDLLLPKNVVNWRGEALCLGEVLDERFVFFKELTKWERGFRFLDNSFEQLRYGADLMMARTDSCLGWRPDTQPDPTPPPEAIAWPTTARRRAQYLDLTHMLDLPVRSVIPPAIVTEPLG